MTAVPDRHHGEARSRSGAAAPARRRSGPANRTFVAGALALLLFAGGARADVFNLPVAEDSAPYSFLPDLNRSTRTKNYVFRDLSDTGAEHSFETFLRFPDLSTVVPPGEVVTAATLFFYYAFGNDEFGDPDAPPGDVYCHEILEGWDQSQLTWNNRPTVDPVPADSTLGVVSFGPLACDVSEIVNAWSTGARPDHGLALISPTERVIGMHAVEADVEPFLRASITIATGPATEVPALSPLGAALVALAAAGLGLRYRRRWAGR